MTGSWAGRDHQVIAVKFRRSSKTRIAFFSYKIGENLDKQLFIKRLCIT
jgi:hypothetical protein